MIDHLTLTVADSTQSRAFFERALAPLGYSVVMTYNEFAGFGEKGKPTFWIKAGPAPQSPMHLAFVAKNRPAVDAFYHAALGAGASDNGPPGPRPHYHAHFYGAFVITPDGHPIEAVCHLPLQAAKRKAAPRKTAAKTAAKRKASARKTKKKVARRQRR